MWGWDRDLNRTSRHYAFMAANANCGYTYYAYLSRHPRLNLYVHRECGRSGNRSPASHAMVVDRRYLSGHLCHHGPLFSDREFHDVRLPYAVDEAGEELREFGRWEGIKLVLRDPFNGLGEHSDITPLLPGELAPDSGSARGHLEFLLRTPHTKGEFKTAGLRNVERTAPYTHRGIYKDLDEALDLFSKSDPEEPIKTKKLRKKKKKKDPNAPVGPKNMFIYFSQAKRADLQKASPDMKTTDITKQLGEMWRNLDEEERLPYKNLAADDKERYQNAMLLYEPANSED